MITESQNNKAARMRGETKSVTGASPPLHSSKSFLFARCAETSAPGRQNAHISSIHKIGCTYKLF